MTGEARAACVFRPATAAALPLVVFLHGSGGSATDIYDHTSLRSKATSFVLSSDPERIGFVLAADQGRTIPNPNGNLGPRARHDVYYRDPASPSTNPDVRNLDLLIDELVAEGGIDADRIFVMGWSNGAFFAHAYAIARHATPTPGGSRVAASATFAGGDPFDEPERDTDPSCRLSPYPTSIVPMLIVGRSCDAAVGCDAAQQAKFAQPPGFDSSGWADTLRTVVTVPVVERLIVDGAGNERTGCTAAALCSGAIGLINHVRWPDGVADGSGNDWEMSMLEFLRDHPSGG